MRPAALLVLPALLAACSDGGTAPGPDAFEFRVGLTYPTLPGRPFGLTVAPNGTVLVTQQDNNRLT
ncbi:MAG TPA: hypothetical protein VFV33_10015, partial [Gemmatimonadaceae bacterium]|nr:hypothetical protein [Gemmatimonadaceae bacterium]